MADIKHLKETAKIGKSLLIRLAGIIENHKKIEYDKILDFKNCSSDCPFLVKRNQCLDTFDDTYCSFHCKKNISYIPKSVYYNEKNRYKLISFENVRLSKLQIKQSLLYHFQNVDNNGFVKYLSEEKLAKELNCSLKTINNNNKRLVDLGFIAYSNTGDNLFNLKILGYEYYHLTKREGGTGYITMSSHLLESLLKIENVNSLRLEIRKLLKADNDSTSDTTTSSYTYTEIKRFLPRYMSKSTIKKIASTQSAGLITIIHDNCIEFEIDKGYDGKLLRKEKQLVYVDEIKETLKEVELEIDSRAVEDLSNMAFEYGIDIIKQALTDISIIYDKVEVYNYCGLVRNYIRNMSFQNIIA